MALVARSSKGFLISLAFLASFASGRELRASSQLRDTPPVTNWPAPPFWAQPPVGARTESVAVVAPTPLPFVALTPCRLVDTRGTAGVPINTGGKFAADEVRTWTFTGLCGLPTSATAVSLNITATGTDANPFGFITVWPAGVTQPNVSTLNWSAGGVTESNAAIVPLGTGGNAGQISLRSSNAGSHVIVDVNGYYAPEALPVGTIFSYTGNATVNTTLAPSGSTNSAPPNETRAAAPIPVPCAVDAFFVFMDTAPTVLTIYTLQRNANDGFGFLNTNATCQIGVGGQVCQAASPSVTFAAGDLAMTSVTGAAGAGGRASVSWRCR